MSQKHLRDADCGILAAVRGRIHDMNTEHCIEVCNGLLRGERSAVETYDKAIEKYGGKTPELARIREEHVRAVSTLENNVRSMGGEPETDTGAWGAFANTVQQAANLFGPDSAIEALQAGEKSGRRDYQIALEDEDVMIGCKEMIRAGLLPQTEDHIGALERLQEAA